MRNVGWRGIVLSVPVLLVGLVHGSAQVTPAPSAPAVPPPSSIEDNAVKQEEAQRPENRKPEERRPTTSGQSTRDETVGYGGSVDRAPRDVREPFDE